MKEIILKDYLDNKITAEILATDVMGSQKKTSYDVTTVYVDKITETGEYNITKEHLIKLIDDTIEGVLTPTDLNTIALALISSEYFTWDYDDKIIDETIYDLDGPEVGFPLTNENLNRWKIYLQTGKYLFDSKELKINEINSLKFYRTNQAMNSKKHE